MSHVRLVAFLRLAFLANSARCGFVHVQPELGGSPSVSRWIRSGAVLGLSGRARFCLTFLGVGLLRSLVRSGSSGALGMALGSEPMD